MVNRKFRAFGMFVCVVFVWLHSTSSLASSRYYLVGAGSPPAFRSAKYETAASACVGAKDENDNWYRANTSWAGNPPALVPDPITGTFTFIQWPDENVPVGGTQTDCIFSFTGGNASGTIYWENSVHHWYVISFDCPNNENFNRATGQCVGYSVSASLPPKPRCNSCGVQALLLDPINVATGAVFDTKNDLLSGSSSLPFNRFYNSTDTGTASLSAGWERSYGRSVVTQYSTMTTQDHLISANTSSQYSDPSAACTSGFAEIKSRVSQWGDALASYSNGNCVLTKNGAYIGSVVVKVSGGIVEPSSTPVAYDVIRDDGQLIRFIVDDNGAIINPPGIGLKLQKTASGYIVADSNDNVEQYDTSGKLLTVTSRTGIVQTMNYDGSGRLSGVSDSFGHQLNFSYDGQGRLSSVMQQ